MKMKRTKNTVVVTEENAGYTIAEPDSDLLFILDNPYVKNVHQQKIFYTKDFYIAMYKLIHDQKKTYVEAYEALGFDVSRLGRSRAEQAGKNAERVPSQIRIPQSVRKRRLGFRLGLRDRCHGGIVLSARCRLVVLRAVSRAGKPGGGNAGAFSFPDSEEQEKHRVTAPDS